MRTQALVFVPILAAMLASPALARIGETLEQSVARYGEATKQKDGSVDFESDGFWINADFKEDKCATISYRRKTNGDRKKVLSPPMNREEFTSLFKQEMGEKPFTIKTMGLNIYFFAEDKSLMGSWDPETNMLMVTSD
jgi:hypothetical protein